MNAYFFKMNKEEKNNILDQHKHAYDGYVTRYNQESNLTPLYVQDYANDKGGITVNNKGVVKNYTNMNINETMLDRIGDGPMDLKNGTVDFDSLEDDINTNHEMMHDLYPSPNEDEDEYFSAGRKGIDNMDNFDIVIDIDTPEDDYEYDIDQMGDFSTEPLTYDDYTDEYQDEDEDGFDFGDVDDEIIPDLMSNLNESLDMFRRFKKYN